MAPDEMIAWKDVVTGGAVVVSALAAITVNVFTKRLDRHEKSDAETFDKIFKAQTALLSEVKDGFRELDKTVNDVHIKLLERISDVQQSKDTNGGQK